MRRFLTLTAILAGIACTAPMAMKAEEHHDKRYYDRDNKDYHTWDDHEDRAYRVYLGEQHHNYREFRKVKPDEQRNYFKWRHDHSDQVLFKVEVR